MKIQQRKFIGMIIGIIILTGVLIVIALIVNDAISPTVMIIYFGSIVFLITAYIGGNVFSAWVRSKYFRPELVVPVISEPSILSASSDQPSNENDILIDLGGRIEGGGR